VSKVAVPGTVEVPELLVVERYPTVLQMTSTVTAELEARLDAVDVIRAMFPCGSVTGVPKISAMQIIHAEEGAPRGVYTGSIGRISTNGDAAFNVAIRTLTVRAGSGRATLGLGSGIVADSNVADEWKECAQKGKFVATPVSFDLIETMRIDGGVVANLDLHLDRLAASAEHLGFQFDREDTGLNVEQAAADVSRARLRLTLSSAGDVSLEKAELVDLPNEISVALAPLPVDSADFRLRHKTTDRAFYDEAREASGCAEVVFYDRDDFITEGSFTNVFSRRDGKLVTPPLARGLLPGVLRRRLIETGEAVEGELTPSDLRDGFFIGNSVRGLAPAELRSSVREPKEVCD
jgi:para-aminobenzoate synthetase/4-amino-4-deoxychorismate lyase